MTETLALLIPTAVFYAWLLVVTYRAIPDQERGWHRAVLALALTVIFPTLVLVAWRYYVRTTLQTFHDSRKPMDL